MQPLYLDMLENRYNKGEFKHFNTKYILNVEEENNRQIMIIGEYSFSKEQAIKLANTVLQLAETMTDTDIVTRNLPSFGE